MITLASLVQLAEEHADDLGHPVVPLRLGAIEHDTDTDPVLMGVVNLSRDSSYRESVAISTESAIRRGRILATQGAHVVDVGAESTRATAGRVGDAAQIEALVPVIENLSPHVVVSVEAYSPAVAEAGLVAGARVLNLTGSVDDETVFALAARYDAAVVLCHVLGPHARDLHRSTDDRDPVPAMLETFGRRVEIARAAGVRDVVIDPGLGFGFDLDDQQARAEHQAAVLMSSFRLRRLGVPVCQALPHAFDLFEDQFRSAEGFFAVLASLGGAGVLRTHEVAHVRAVLGAMAVLPVRLQLSGGS